MKAKIFTEALPEIEDVKDHILMGGIDPAPSWEEYLSEFDDLIKPHISAIRGCIEDTGLRMSRASRKANNTVFKTEDGHFFRFSWRAWGDLIQAIEDKREGYMTYYM